MLKYSDESELNPVMHLPGFGRGPPLTPVRFEKELEKLRKEMEQLSATGALTTPSSASSPYPDHEPLSPGDGSQTDMDVNSSPLILPGTNDISRELEVPDLVLEGHGDGGERRRTKTD